MDRRGSLAGAEGRIVQLGDVAETQLGKTINPRTKRGPRQRPYLRNANVRWDRVDLADVATMHFSEPESAAYDLKAGDLLVCEGGIVGRAAIWRGELDECHFQNAIHRVRPINGDVSGQWLLENLRWLSTSGRLAEAAQGVTIQHLSQRQLRALPIFVPPRDLQDALLHQLAEIRKLVASATAQVARARLAITKFRHTILAAACSGLLTTTWRSERSVDSTGTDLLDDIIAQRRERARAGDRPRTGTLRLTAAQGSFEIPDTWTWATWNDLADWITYGFTRPMPHSEQGVPIVTAKNVRDGRISFEDAAYTTSAAFAELSDKDVPRPGEILLTKDGSIGRAAIVPAGTSFCINQSVAVVRFGGMSANAHYLKLAIEAPFTQRSIAEAAKGSAIQHIAITSFGRLQLPVPPLDEQFEIVRIVNALMDHANSTAKRMQVGEARAQRICDLMLDSALGAALSGGALGTRPVPIDDGPARKG